MTSPAPHPIPDARAALVFLATINAGVNPRIDLDGDGCLTVELHDGWTLWAEVNADPNDDEVRRGATKVAVIPDGGTLTVPVDTINWAEAAVGYRHGLDIGDPWTEEAWAESVVLDETVNAALLALEAEVWRYAGIVARNLPTIVSAGEIIAPVYGGTIPWEQLR